MMMIRLMAMSHTSRLSPSFFAEENDRFTRLNVGYSCRRHFFIVVSFPFDEINNVGNGIADESVGSNTNVLVSVTASMSVGETEGVVDDSNVRLM
jgi:hypothetical protein